MATATIELSKDSANISFIGEKPLTGFRLSFSYAKEEDQTNSNEASWGRDFPSPKPTEPTVYSADDNVRSLVAFVDNRGLTHEEKKTFVTAALASEGIPTPDSRSEMTEKPAPNPRPQYMCLWPDEDKKNQIAGLVEDGSLKPTERQRFAGLLNRSMGIPARLVVTYPRGIWVAHITGEFHGEGESGRANRDRGARIVGHRHLTDADVFVVIAAFPEDAYHSYIRCLH